MKSAPIRAVFKDGYICISGRRPQMRTYLFNRSFQVETLENRLCLSCTVDVDGSHLRIVGDDTPNTVSVVDDGAGGVVAICDGMPAVVATGIKKISIDT